MSAIPFLCEIFYAKSGQKIEKTTFCFFLIVQLWNIKRVTSRDTSPDSICDAWSWDYNTELASAWNEHFVLPKPPHNWIWCFFPNLITFWYFNLYQKKFSKTQLYFPPTTAQLHSWRGAVGAGLALAGLTTTEANSKMFLFCFYLLNWEFTKKWGVSWK